MLKFDIPRYKAQEDDYSISKHAFRNKLIYTCDIESRVFKELMGYSYLHQIYACSLVWRVRPLPLLLYHLERVYSPCIINKFFSFRKKYNYGHPEMKNVETISLSLYVNYSSEALGMESFEKWESGVGNFLTKSQ